MALPALATIEGLEDRGVDVSDGSRAQAAIDDASALIHHVTGNRWVLDGGLDPAMPPVVSTVAYKVIRRALGNPEAVESEQLGPSQVTYRATEGDTYLTDDERALLINSLGTTTGLSSVRLEAPWPIYRDCTDLDDDEVDEGS